MFGTYRTGQKAPESGIYRCTAFLCGERKTVSRGKRLPPCSHGHREWEIEERTTKSRKRKQKSVLDQLFG